MWCLISTKLVILPKVSVFDRALEQAMELRSAKKPGLIEANESIPMEHNRWKNQATFLDPIGQSLSRNSFQKTQPSSLFSTSSL